MAAPIASQVFGEVLPYLEIKKDNQEEQRKQEVEVPSVIGMTKKEAKKVLEEIGLTIETKESLNEGSNSEVNGTQEGEAEDKIEYQLPKAGIKIKQGTAVLVDK